MAVGKAVTKFKVGDRVSVNQHWTNLTGMERDEEWIALVRSFVVDKDVRYEIKADIVCLISGAGM